jgi:hypothetical protein
VLVNGMPTVTIASPYSVAGCVMPPPIAGNGPCVIATFYSSAVRLTSNAVPLLLFDSQAIAAPTGTPLLPPVSIQTRVTGM